MSQQSYDKNNCEKNCDIKKVSWVNEWVSEWHFFLHNCVVTICFCHNIFVTFSVKTNLHIYNRGMCSGQLFARLANFFTSCWWIKKWQVFWIFFIKLFFYDFFFFVKRLFFLFKVFREKSSLVGFFFCKNYFFF